jgi:hypothetical protein
MMENTVWTYLTCGGQEYPIAPTVMLVESPQLTRPLLKLKASPLWPNAVGEAFQIKWAATGAWGFAFYRLWEGLKLTVMRYLPELCSIFVTLYLLWAQSEANRNDPLLLLVWSLCINGNVILNTLVRNGKTNLPGRKLPTRAA